MTAASALPRMTEKAWMAQVTELARTLGWRVYHPWLSIRSERGWPDLAFVRPGRFVMAELKTDRGKLTPSQEEWIDALRGAGVEVHVWRPADWDDVVEVLRP